MRGHPTPNHQRTNEPAVPQPTWTHNRWQAPLQFACCMRASFTYADSWAASTCRLPHKGTNLGFESLLTALVILWRNALSHRSNGEVGKEPASTIPLEDPAANCFSKPPPKNLSMTYFDKIVRRHHCQHAQRKLHGSIRHRDDVLCSARHIPPNATALHNPATRTNTLIWKQPRGDQQA